MPHDAIYKLLFSLPCRVTDLLRGFMPGGWTRTLDLTTLKPPAEYVGEGLYRRLGDMLWRIRFDGPTPRSHARERKHYRHGRLRHGPGPG